MPRANAPPNGAPISARLSEEKSLCVDRADARTGVARYMHQPEHYQVLRDPMVAGKAARHWRGECLR